MHLNWSSRSGGTKGKSSDSLSNKQRVELGYFKEILLRFLQCKPQGISIIGIMILEKYNNRSK